MRILGVTASGIIGPGDFELIQTTVLPSNTPSVTFGNLQTYASDYKHLQLRITSRSDHAGAAVVFMRVNGDAGNNYAWHSLYGDGSSVATAQAGTDGGIFIPIIPSATETSNVFSATVIDILDAYSSSKNTTFMAIHGSETLGARRASLNSGAWFNTASITQIVLSTYANYVAGSRFSLYGIRG